VGSRRGLTTPGSIFPLCFWIGEPSDWIPVNFRVMPFYGKPCGQTVFMGRPENPRYKSLKTETGRNTAAVSA
jgi:hypothetical protein